MRDPLSKQTELGNSVYSPLMWAPGSFSNSGTGATDGTGVAATNGKISGHIYRIKFFGNPGKLREPEIITHLDGKRPSLMSTVFAIGSKRPSTTAAVITKVWTDGQQGEDKDYFADHCDGVTVAIQSDDISSDEHVKTTTATKNFTLVPGRMTWDGSDWNKNMDSAMVKLLKKCLGDSDATSTNNVEIYDWDYGSEDYPHLIKLVRSVTSATDGGYYVAVIFVKDAGAANDNSHPMESSDDDYFKILNPFVPPDAIQGDTFEVYTTKGTLSRVSSQAAAHFGFASNKVITTHVEKESAAGNYKAWDGDLSCEVAINNGFRVAPSVYVEAAVGATQKQMSAATLQHNGDDVDVFISDVVTEWTYNYENGERTATAHYKNCLNKTDIITFLNPLKVHQNPQHINLYTIERLVKDKAMHSNIAKYLSADADTGEMSAVGNDGTAGVGDTPQETPMKYGTNVITLDLSTNWATDVGALDTTVSDVGHTYVYKFVPAAASTYEYVAECSNRGLCDRDSGTCTCFAGYTSDSCSEQSSLAI